MSFRGWLISAAFAIMFLLIGCSRADPSLIAAGAPVDGGVAGEAAAPVEVAADEAALAYQQTSLTGPADAAFTVNFNNPAAVEHNWVMVEPGQEDAVAAAASAAGGDPTGIDGVIAGHDPIATGSVSVPVPATPAGTYTYLCTVPGHYAAGMVGEITLGEATAEGPPPGDAGSSFESAPAASQPAAEPAPADAAGGEGANEVAADPTLLQYQQTSLTVPAEQETTITFNNPSAVPHNWVLVEPGQEQAVATAAAATNGDPTGIDGVITGGAPIASSSEPITIPALEAGEYPYICTVPGHYQAGMVGTLTVE
jgi:uncharacterized cupredoxin-like copper-binding protein